MPAGTHACTHTHTQTHKQMYANKHPHTQAYTIGLTYLSINLSNILPLSEFFISLIYGCRKRTPETSSNYITDRIVN